MSTSPTPFDHDAALAYLNGRINYERHASIPYRSRGLKLDRMRELLSRLGNPHQQYPVVHVAGTKGKGSTAAIIAGILTAAGYRTGLYTSPHLECVEERMAIDGQPCSGAEFVDLLEAIRPVVEELDREALGTPSEAQGPTYFEITTAASLLHFHRRSVDVAIVEVGLGGRTDSTNVLQPVVAVITSISLDHTRQLGNTLSSIAAHKAGIIKPGVPVVSGVTEPEPRDVIERIAQENGCRCYRLQRDFRVSYGGSQVGSQVEGGIGTYATTGATFDYEEDCGPTPVSLRSLSIAMLGRHQTSNAAVALATLGRLGERGWRVTEAAIRCGLARVHMPARTEVVQQRPTVIVDVAHNVASVRALVEVIRETCPRTTTRRRILVFAASQDKDVATMLRILLPEFDVVVVTRFVNNPRAANPNALRAAAEQVLAAGEIRPCELLQEADAEAAWRRAHAIATPDDLICVAGSFFLASDVWSLLPRQRGATPDAAR